MSPSESARPDPRDPPWDRWDLYERTVQSPALLVPLLRSIHGGEPSILGEDFCGSAALSRAWVEGVASGRAIAVDRDAEALERARGVSGVELVRGDVRSAADPALHAADVIFAGNFSIGELHERAQLVDYLCRARARLRPCGVFVCDTYAGAPAWRTGALERSRFTADGARIRWTWEQRSVDVETSEVVDALHFRVERAGEIVLDLPDAFVYAWRLWSLAELRDALLEAGFARCEVRTELAESPLHFARDPDALLVACIVGRTG